MPCVNTSGGNKLIEGYNTTMALPVFHEKLAQKMLGTVSRI
jgi:hypothetical protein